MLCVDDIMVQGKQMSAVQGHTCVRELLEIMDQKQLGAVCVVEKEILLGIITDGDLRRLILRTQDTLPNLFMKRADSIMVHTPKTVTSKTSLEKCFHLLMQHRFWVVPVVDTENRLLGIVHMHDLVRAKFQQTEKD